MTAKILIGVAVAFAVALAWGYWQASTHAYLSLRVEDYGLRDDRQSYASPHDVTLSLFDEANKLLAHARSVEPAGYIVAVHPDPAIGDCSRHQNSQADYARCYAPYSAWASGWALRARTAHATIGSCVLRNLPVAVRGSNTEWLLWWIPLPHVGGVPRRHVELVLRVNSKTCSPAPL